MKLTKLVGERVKQNQSGATIKSHNYMLRAGYIKQVATGIYTLLTPARKSVLKIENIIREEMNKVDGQEMLFPVVMPRELWEESGRYDSIGSELLRFTDRFRHDMVLGMTHEEAAVNVCKNVIRSYDQLPFMIYQIQTKFRDEARSRAGLIRVREFTMKDAYSFHENQKDLEDYYYRVYDAYNNIFKRIGMENFIAVKGDSGMMGGSIAHEYMLLTDAGEDTLALCQKCDFKANVEVATAKIDVATTVEESLEEVFTGKAKTIEEVCKLLNKKPNETCKAVCYAIKGDNSRGLVVFIRGDLEVNECKVKAILKEDIVPNDLTDSEVLVAGNIGPLNLKDKNLVVIYDKSLENEKSLIIGANKVDFHFKGFSFKRDMKVKEFLDVAKANEHMYCPVCGGKLKISNGIEIGNIFQLGTKYSKAMNMTVHGRDGKDFYPIMGCYGIGVGRALASVLEEKSDDKGLVFPVSIAPWHVYLCPLNYNDEGIKKIADKTYDDMQKNNIEVLFDDREVSAGVKFADSELMGIPIRVVLSARSLQNNEAEITMRASGEKVMVKLSDLVATIKKTISACLSRN